MSFCSKHFPIITAPSSPALRIIVLAGTSIDRLTISTPVFWSLFPTGKSDNILDAYRRAKPPPGTTPSSTAARVAFNASVIRSFFSLTTTSELPPT